MRIVNYHPRALAGDGGITNSVRHLSEAFGRLGADPVIAYDGAGGGHRDQGVQWVPVEHRGPRRFRVPLDLRSALRDADVVILNSAWTAANVRAGSIARRASVPYVLAPRGAYDPLIFERRRLLKRLWWTALEKRLVEGASAIHCFFAVQAADLARHGYTGRVVIAPNGVAVPPGARWDGGSGGYVLYLGRFDPEHKGLDLLLHAMANLSPADRPHLRMHGPDWVGGKQRVKELVSHLHLDAVVSVGAPLYGDEKWRMIEQASGLVYLSRWEGFGNSLAEAGALGVPILATPYPLAEYLAGQGACLLVGSSPDEIAAGLGRLLGDEGRATGARARDVLRSEFTWDAIAARWLDQVQEL